MLHGDDLKKGAWTPEEDILLKRLVDQLGPARWSIVAERIPGRSGKSCRLRWHNHLSPAVKKAPFSEYEDAVILKAHDIHGNKWSVIAKLLPGRTDNAVKNRWNSTLKRKAGTQGLRNRFLAKGVTLELLLTQFAHHAHDNANPGGGAHHAHHHSRGHGSPCDSSDSGSDDLDGMSPSGATRSTGAGADGSTGSGASDDEGSSPMTRGGAHHQHVHHQHVHGGSYMPPMWHGGAAHAAAAAGMYQSPYDYAGTAAAATAAHGYPAPQQACPAVGTGVGPGAAAGVSMAGAACVSVGTIFSEEDDCCDTLDMHLWGMGSPGSAVHAAAGVAPFFGAVTADPCEDTDPHGTIQNLLDDFAAAGAAAAGATAAAAANAGSGAHDPYCSSSGASCGGADMACGGSGSGLWRNGSKRDIASSLADADVDGTASPLKRLRLGGDSCGNAFASVAPCIDDVDVPDELPICYADQRAAASDCGAAAPLATAAAAAAALRQQHVLEQPPEAVLYELVKEEEVPELPVDADVANAAAAALPAAGCDAGLAAAFGGGPFDLLDALPFSIRSCLVDAAALYLANDADGLLA